MPQIAENAPLKFNRIYIIQKTNNSRVFETNSLAANLAMIATAFKKIASACLAAWQ